MRAQLQTLLERAGYSLPPGRSLLDHVIITKNETSIPVSPLWPEPLMQRGFQALLLNDRGKPVQYARFADARIETFERECLILDRLNAEPRASGLIPRSRSVSSGHIRVQVAEYLPTTRDLRATGALSRENFLETVRSALVVRDRLCAVAASVMPELIEGSREIPLLTRATPALTRLREDPLVAIDLEPIERLFRGTPPVRQHLQHGDFWPGNLILHEGSWRVIDFEDFARANLPLYDEFHFIQATARMGATGAGAGWFPAASRRAPRPWTRTWAELIDERATHYDVDVDTAAALLAFYVVHMCAHRMRPGVAPVVSADLRSDLHAIVEALRNGAAPRSLLPTL